MCKWCDDSSSDGGSSDTDDDYSDILTHSDDISEDADTIPTETLSRVLSSLESDYLAHARSVLARLTGEKFSTNPVPWLVCGGSDGRVQMTPDGYSARFSIILEYTGNRWNFLEEDIMTLAIGTGMSLRDAVSKLSSIVFQARLIATTSAGLWPIYLPKPDDLPRVLSTMWVGQAAEMTLGDAVEEYLRRRLHQLTVYLPFVGGPRCTCVSKRDPNPGALSMREMVKLERRGISPGQSILATLGAKIPTDIYTQ